MNEVGFLIEVPTSFSSIEKLAKKILKDGYIFTQLHSYVVPLQ